MSIAHQAISTIAAGRSRSPLHSHGRGRAEAPPIVRRIRPALRRWVAVAMLLVASAIAVLYVANAIAVDNLMVDITSLERERDAVLRDNERLRAELLRLMAVDRITGIAVKNFGMTMPMHPPRVITAKNDARESGGTMLSEGSNR